MDNILTVPIHLKMTLTAREAAEYSSIGIYKIDSMLRAPNCPFVLFIGAKKPIKRREFEPVHRPYNGDWKASSLLRKESPCATIIKCIKVLQKLPGHAGIRAAMDRHIHAANDSMSKAVL